MVHKALLVMLSAEGGFAAELSTLSRRPQWSGRLSVDFEVDPLADEIALPSTRRRTQDRRKTTLHIRVSRCPRRHADAHRCLTLPDGAAAPTGAIALDTRNHLARAL
jgi:hypothetical protein